MTASVELREIFEADQQDRKQVPLQVDVNLRDAARRERVLAIIEAGGLAEPEDYFHAAMVFQHGTDLKDYQRAHQLARKAAEMGYRPGRWLAAAAYDRWLMSQGQPQKYGTQYRDQNGVMVLWTVDPETTDEERAQWDVPPLAEPVSKYKFDWGQAVRVTTAAPLDYRPGHEASIVARRTITELDAPHTPEPEGTRLYGIEYGDGSSVEVAERFLEPIDDSAAGG